MKPWAKYTFNGKEWIPDREADIITHLKEEKEKRYQESLQRTYQKWGEKLRAAFDTMIEEELTKGIKTMSTTIAPTNVITFTYLNAGDDANPVVLVTGVSEDHVMGYNLNYYKEKGLAFRKYTRCFMSNVENLTENSLKPKVLKFKDLAIGTKFVEKGYPQNIFVKTDLTKAVILTGNHPFNAKDIGRIVNGYEDIKVEKV